MKGLTALISAALDIDSLKMLLRGSSVGFGMRTEFGIVFVFTWRTNPNPLSKRKMFHCHLVMLTSFSSFGVPVVPVLESEDAWNYSDQVAESGQPWRK